MSSKTATRPVSLAPVLERLTAEDNFGMSFALFYESDDMTKLYELIAKSMGIPVVTMDVVESERLFGFDSGSSEPVKAKCSICNEGFFLRFWRALDEETGELFSERGKKVVIGNFRLSEDGQAKPMCTTCMLDAMEMDMSDNLRFVTRQEMERLQKIAALTAPQPQKSGPPPAPSLEELERLHQKFLLKAETCRFVATRNDSEESNARYHELVGRAKSMGKCFLWMLDQSIRQGTRAEYELVAACYENLGLAVEVMIAIDTVDAPVTQEDLLTLAEPQSAILALCSTFKAKDYDQIGVYVWLKEITSLERIFLEQFMSHTAPADPKRHKALKVELEALKTKFQAITKLGQKRGKKGLK